MYIAHSDITMYNIIQIFFLLKCNYVKSIKNDIKTNKEKIMQNTYSYKDNNVFYTILSILHTLLVRVILVKVKN